MTELDLGDNHIMSILLLDNEEIDVTVMDRLRLDSANTIGDITWIWGWYHSGESLS